MPGLPPHSVPPHRAPDGADTRPRPDEGAGLGTSATGRRGQARKKCSAAQRASIEANYGKKAPECEKRVKARYVELDMEAVYKKYEEEAYLELRAVIESKDNTLPPELFGAMLKKIYKRSK